MWLLSCDDDDLLQGKRLWLRPGSTHLLGRTSSKQSATGERVRYIDHKSVSRKHLLLAVADVNRGDSAQAYSRSSITATDSSRSGTYINGEQLKQAETTLQEKAEYVLKLGSLSARFILRWTPVVLSFTNLPKSTKSNGTALKDERAKLASSDIRLSLDYLPGETTHVIAKKRNNPSALQALLQARWLVTDSFVDVLADRCRRRGGDGENDPDSSPLEDDFDANWPREEDYLVRTAGEPVARPNDCLIPDPSRAEVFADFTFIFLSRPQYDALVPVITAGSGKALVYEYFPGETTVDEVVKYAQEVAGKKKRNETGTARSLLSQETSPGGIVIVRIASNADGRSASFINEISLALDQRTIEQSELLDAIITKDTGNFRTPLRDPTQDALDNEMNDAPPPSSAIPQPPGFPPSRSSRPSRSQPPRTVLDSPQEEESHRSDRSAGNISRLAREPDPREKDIQPVYRRPYVRKATTTRYTDDFDPSKVIDDDDDSDDEPANSQPNRPANQQRISRDEPSQHVVDAQYSSRKRPAPLEPESEEETEQQFFDRVMPAQAALKRRKTEALEKGDKPFLQPTPTPEPERKTFRAPNRNSSNKGPKGKENKVEAEMAAKMRARLEKEEEERRQDEANHQEALHQNLEDLTIEHNIETFDVPRKPARQSATSRTRNEDHPEWNDRQNFKKFRSNKNKASHPHNQVRPRLIIPVEAVPGKSNGLGDEYWLETGRDNPRRRAPKSSAESASFLSAAASQHRQSGSAVATANGTEQLDDADEEDDANAFRRRLHRSREDDAEDLRATAEAVDDDLPPGTISQTMRSHTPASKPPRGKRPAAQADLPTPSLSKRPRHAAAAATAARTQAIELSDDDSDDDEMAFRRRRR